MTKEQVEKLQKQLSKKMIDIIKKDPSTHKTIEKLRVFDELLNHLNRAAFYLKDPTASQEK